MTETQERFLRAVLTRVPLDSIVELHLFPPIRRGTLETGVAVIATELPPAGVSLVVDDESDAAAAHEPVEAGEEDVAGAGDIEVTAEREVTAQADVETDAKPAEAVGASEPAVEVEIGEDGVEAPADVEFGIAMPSDVAAHPAPSPRTRILTAAYRHTIKGVERGKWIVDVQEEADAPLDAVELVLRGVRHRSTEPADPELVSHETLVALMAASVVAPAA